MGASAALVCIPSGMPVSCHSSASRLLQEAAGRRGSDGSASRGRQARRDLWTRDLERTSRRSRTVVYARWGALANRAARSVATCPKLGVTGLVAGYNLGAYYGDTNAKDSGYPIAGRNMGKSTGTVFIQKTF